jgi:hypothetical protein
VPALTTNNVLGLVLIASAVAIFLAFAIIEPATARAAFGLGSDRGQSDRGQTRVRPGSDRGQTH